MDKYQAGLFSGLFFRLEWLIVLVVLSFSSTAYAVRWLDGWDNAQRFKLAYLADQSEVNIPVSVWPLPWHGAVPFIEEDCSSVVKKASRRVCLALKKEWQYKEAISEVVSLDFYAANQSLIFHSFDQTPHEKGLLKGDYFLEAENWQFNAALNIYQDAEDDESFRVEGSYLSRQIGDWSLLLGALPQWWGPNIDQSLILSSNARDFPAIFLTRSTLSPFETSWLRWVGPWHFVTFMGQLDDDGRYVDHPLLWGARLTFKPFSSFEIGASRTAMWGGEGRKKTPRIFLDLLLGQDNYEGDKTNEPGNQLGGFDFRWSHASETCTQSVYGQWIGEDEAGMMPSRPIGSLGVTMACPGRHGLFDYFIEVSDTALDFYNSEKLYGSAYQHGLYQTGYQYYGRVLGSSFDNDARTVSLGLFWQDFKGVYSSSIKLRHLNLNRDNVAVSDFTNTASAQALKTNQLEVMVKAKTRLHTFSAGVSMLDELPLNQFSVDSRLTVWLGYGFVFGQKAI